MANHSMEIPVDDSGSGVCSDVRVGQAVGAFAGWPGDVDPDHHLWRNGRLWWIAFTVHRGYVQERVRRSLQTDDVEVARRRRDEIFASYADLADCELSLRLSRRKRAARKSASQRRAGRVG